jgi:hypothetical protein
LRRTLGAGWVVASWLMGGVSPPANNRKSP